MSATSGNSEAPKFKSHIPAGPRPEISGRSDSSGSSTGRTSKSKSSAGGSRDNSVRLEDDDDDSDDLLENLASSGMPKSRSEPLNLKAKLEKRSAAGAVTKRDKTRLRSTSKSPRNSGVIPGVRIPELKLKPRETKKKSEPANAEKTPTAESDKWAVPRSTVRANKSPNQEAPSNSDNVVLGSSMSETLTPANVNRLQDREKESPKRPTTTARHFDLKGPVSSSLSACLTASTCSNISSIQPPSMMESVMSMSGNKVESPRLHRQGIKKAVGGIPETVRRALGASGPGSTEDLSSMSSCVSNLDNIQPPTIMDDVMMDASIISVASIKSEVADNNVPAERVWQKQDSKDSDSPSLGRKLGEHSAVETLSIDGIQRPTLMEDVSTAEMTEKTLVPELRESGKGGTCETYTVGHPEDGAAVGVSTCHDVTDVFEDDTTLAESDNEAVPELPRDSRQATPSHSGGESSREGTPRSRRGNNSSTMNYFRKFRVPTPNIDDSSEAGGVHDTSGYRSAETTTTAAAASPTSSRLRRKEDVDRFKTHTISKEDLTPKSDDQAIPFMKKSSFAKLLAQQESASDSSSVSGSPKRSPKSVKQRREEEAERFRTRTITQADLKANQQSLSLAEAQMLEHEASIVAGAIEDNKDSARSRSASVDYQRRQAEEATDDRKRKSASIDILDEEDMDLTIEIQTPIRSSPRSGPQICKPADARPAATPPNEDGKGVRGRRKPLYSSPTKKPSVVPPAVAPKPTIAPKPKYMSSLSSPGRVGSPPRQIRGTRASNLRQTSQVARRNSPPTSPRMASPLSLNSGYSSAASTCSSRASSGMISRQSSGAPSARSSNTSRSEQQPPLLRQGTFTKEDSSSNTMSSDDGRKGPRQQAAKSSPKSIRRDIVHPAGARGGLGAKPPISATSRGKLGTEQHQQPRFGQPRPAASRNVPGKSTSKLPHLGSPRALRKNPSTSSNGSLASIRSAKSSNLPVPRSVAAMSASKSSHNLRTANDSLSVRENMGRRVPSSSSIEHKAGGGVEQQARLASVDSSAAQGGHDKKSTKDVTSRIANLWKKVEDSKKKKNEKDPRVWITQGKVIPEKELAYLRPHEEQRQLIKQQQQQQVKSTATTGEMKPRSKSRLSLKLSKFKNKKDDKTPTSPREEESDYKIEDSINGNVVPPAADNDPSLPPGRFQTPHSPTTPSANLPEEGDGDDSKTKRHSRLGSFFNPETSATTSTPAQSTTSGKDQLQQPQNAIKFNGPKRSPAQASAIVPPFNYSPPTRQMNSSSSSSSAQVRRNDSYVSSMGRRPGVVDGGEADEAPTASRGRQDKTKDGNNSSAKAASSSSVMTVV